MNALRRALLTVLAILFLIEAWIWDLFSTAGHWIAGVLRLSRVIDAFRDFIATLSPYATLPLFILPALAILPFKVLALWLIAHGHIVYGGLAFFAAKTAGVGVTAVLFDLCRERLLSIGWFAACYVRVIAVRDWAHDLTAPLRAKIAALRDTLTGWLGEGRFGRHVLALRARIRRRLAR